MESNEIMSKSTEDQTPNAKTTKRHKPDSDMIPQINCIVYYVSRPDECGHCNKNALLKTELSNVISVPPGCIQTVKI